MTTSTASRATIGSGLPPGVRRGGLGRRFLAQLIDLVVPAILVNVAVAAQLTIVTIACGVGILVREIVVWAMFATRAAGPGMRLVNLQLVTLCNGWVIGWGRYLVRALILLVLTATGIGLLVLIFLLISQRRHQGLHDLAVQSVVIVARPLAPPLVRRPAADRQEADKEADQESDEDAAVGVVDGEADDELADDELAEAEPDADRDGVEATATGESDTDDTDLDEDEIHASAHAPAQRNA